MRQKDFSIRQSGPRQLPNVQTYRFFKTISGPDATAYPDSADEPTVYYAVMLKNVSFPETVGAQSLTSEETTTKKHIFNLAAEDYIEEGTIVLGFPMNGQWYTIDKVKARAMIVVGHDLIPTDDGDANLTALDFDGNVLWRLQMGVDSLGNYKKPIHVRFDERGFIYVVWNSHTLESALSSGTKRNELNADIVGGVTKYDANGNQKWNTEFSAQAAGGGILIPQAGNCLDIAPDGSVWVGTYNDINNNTIHQLSASTGGIIQEFGKSIFNSSAPFATSEFSQADTGMEVCAWLRVTSEGNLWFIYGNGQNDLRGPYKCDSSGNISLGYGYNFASFASFPNTLDHSYSVLVLGDDDIVVSGIPAPIGTSGPPPLGSARSMVQRWTPSTDTLQWGSSPGDFTPDGTWLDTVYNPWGYWVDGNASKIFYSEASQLYQDTTGHRYALFSSDGAGNASFMSSIGDITAPRTDPEDYVGNRGAIAYVPAADACFIAHGVVLDGLYSGSNNSLVSRINPGNGRSVWNSNLGMNADLVRLCNCIAAFSN